MARNRVLIPEARDGLSKFKAEVARELGVPFSDYNGDLTSRECGSVGGEMVKRMVQEYESKLKQLTMNYSEASLLLKYLTESEGLI